MSSFSFHFYLKYKNNILLSFTSAIKWNFVIPLNKCLPGSLSSSRYFKTFKIKHWVIRNFISCLSEQIDASDVNFILFSSWGGFRSTWTKCNKILVLFIQTIFSFKTKIFNGGNSKDEFIVCTPTHTHTHICIHTHRTFIHLLTTETLIRKNPGTLEFKNFRFSVIFNNGFEHFAFLCLYPEMDKPVKTGLKKQSLIFMLNLGFTDGSAGTESNCNVGDTADMGSVPGSGRSLGWGNDNPLQSSCLKNPMDRAAWRTTVHRVTKSQTWLPNWACTFFLINLGQGSKITEVECGFHHHIKGNQYDLSLLLLIPATWLRKCVFGFSCKVTLSPIPHCTLWNKSHCAQPTLQECGAMFHPLGGGVTI